MEQLTYLGPRELAWREVPAPSLDSDRAALVRPLAVATCDLDALIIAGESPFPAPFPLGHECVAEVIDVGDDVRAVKPGQRVSVPFQISCGDCAACRRGRTGSCRTEGPMSTYGFGPAVHRWGGFLSDSVLVPFADHMLVAVPDGACAGGGGERLGQHLDAWRSVGPALAEEPGHRCWWWAAPARDRSACMRWRSRSRWAPRPSPTPISTRAASGSPRSLGAHTLAPWPERVGPFPITVDANATQEGITLALRSTAPDGICTSTRSTSASSHGCRCLRCTSKIVTFKTGRVHARPIMPEVLELAERGAFARAHHHPGRRLLRCRRRAPGGDWTKLVLERNRCEARRALSFSTFVQSFASRAHNVIENPRMEGYADH